MVLRLKFINVSIKETFEEIKINIKDNGKEINEEKVLKGPLEII